MLNKDVKKMKVILMKKAVSIMLSVLLFCFCFSVISFCGDINRIPDELDDAVLFDEEASFPDIDGNEIIGGSDEKSYNYGDSKYLKETAKNLMGNKRFLVVMGIFCMSILLFIPMLIVMIVFIVLNSKAKKKLVEYKKSLSFNRVPVNQNGNFTAFSFEPERKGTEENE